MLETIESEKDLGLIVNNKLVLWIKLKIVLQKLIK